MGVLGGEGGGRAAARVAPPRRCHSVPMMGDTRRAAGACHPAAPEATQPPDGEVVAAHWSTVPDMVCGPGAEDKEAGGAGGAWGHGMGEKKVEGEMRQLRMPHRRGVVRGGVNTCNVLRGRGGRWTRQDAPPRGQRVVVGNSPVSPPGATLCPPASCPSCRGMAGLWALHVRMSAAVFRSPPPCRLSVAHQGARHGHDRKGTRQICTPPAGVAAGGGVGETRRAGWEGQLCRKFSLFSCFSPPPRPQKEEQGPGLL